LIGTLPVSSFSVDLSQSDYGMEEDSLGRRAGIDDLSVVLKPDISIAHPYL
jgi:hypothetical protein